MYRGVRSMVDGIVLVVGVLVEVVLCTGDNVVSANDVVGRE